MIYVTILILIDGFLQYNHTIIKAFKRYSHNPYFNRWFSAIYPKKGLRDLKKMSQSLF